ncbi:extracellular solute-binding protein [Psychromicrobium xiongbiense]|uniref:extracellular solute-binding protein n=1 Tax=Psychromicrobium xiongbiense TaxID=3051184 RepID=UPI0025567154|nr:extracellular solute-binding protein [Psychromicrobium sp. YIM S02556]
MKLSRLMAPLAALAVASLALAGCSQGSSSSSSASDGSAQKLTVFLSADTNIQDLWQKTLIPAFQKANPGYTVSVDLDLHGLHDQQTVAKLTAATVQHKDPGYDLVDAGFVSQVAASGLLAPVSSSDIPELKDVPADLVSAGGNGGIPYRGSSVVLAYDTKTVPTPPKTLDDLLSWIKANPGKFTYNTPDSGGSGQAFVTTVLDKTIPADQRTKMATSYAPETETAWNDGFATLAGLNPYVYQKGVYPNGNNQVLDLLSSGQISMAPVWSDQFVTGKKNGHIPDTVGYTQISDPSFTGGASYLGIPSASPRQEGARKLVSWLLSPAAQALVADSISGYPVIALDKLPASVQSLFKDADIAHLRPSYFASMSSDLNKNWSQKVPGK